MPFLLLIHITPRFCHNRIMKLIIKNNLRANRLAFVSFLVAGIIKPLIQSLGKEFSSLVKLICARHTKFQPLFPGCVATQLSHPGAAQSEKVRAKKQNFSLLNFYSTSFLCSLRYTPPTLTNVRWPRSSAPSSLEDRAPSSVLLTIYSPPEH